MPTRVLQGRESMELRSPRPQQGRPTQKRCGAGQGTDPNSEPKRVAGVKRVSEQKKVSKLPEPTDPSRFGNFGRRLGGTSSRRNSPTRGAHTSLKNPQPSCLMWPHSRRTELSVACISVQTEHKKTQVQGSCTNLLGLP